MPIQLYQQGLHLLKTCQNNFTQPGRTETFSYITIIKSKQQGIFFLYIGIKKQKWKRNNTENNGWNVIKTTNFTRVLNCSFCKLDIKHFWYRKTLYFVFYWAHQVQNRRWKKISFAKWFQLSATPEKTMFKTLRL